jgi:hypothetical protein
MRSEDLNNLNTPYSNSNRERFDRRFHSAISADVPSAGKLVNEIFDDLDEKAFGISWWKTPDEERIFISDYLYQCAEGIETNLVEARLHYLEWLAAREIHNNRIADGIRFHPNGEPFFKHPPSTAPIDDLPNKLEGLHICGFFRAIGSSLDCLGGAIIGVLGLKSSLRMNDIKNAERALEKIKNPQNPGETLQKEFREFFELIKEKSGPKDWLEWVDRYRNMFVHRGRRMYYNEILPRDVALYNQFQQRYLKATSNLHLAKNPDKSEAEAFIKKDMYVNEEADITFKGVFKSCRDLHESVCERLVSIWQQRRNDSTLIEQPQMQWNDNFKDLTFDGYDPNAEPFMPDVITANQTLQTRLRAASAFTDAQRKLWEYSRWNR